MVVGDTVLSAPLYHSFLGAPEAIKHNLNQLSTNLMVFGPPSLVCTVAVYLLLPHSAFLVSLVYVSQVCVSNGLQSFLCFPIRHDNFQKINLMLFSVKVLVK